MSESQLAEKELLGRIVLMSDPAFPSYNQIQVESSLRGWMSSQDGEAALMTKLTSFLSRMSCQTCESSQTKESGVSDKLFHRDSVN